MKARFQLNHEDADEFGPERNTHFELLDKLMGQIPGLDNQGANLTDEAFGSLAYEMEDHTESVGQTPLNAAKYHRWFKAAQKEAFGLTTRRRGFNDNNMFVAKTTQPGVVPVEIEYCTGPRRRQVCEWQEHRFSYAIPLEILYMTPLSKWNPYNITDKGHPSTDEAKTVRADGRSGQMSQELAYNGTNSITYYLTPGEFYDGEELASDPADTTGRGVTGVLDADGELRAVRDSGHRIFFPPIREVGTVRQRYHIMPIYGEGSSVWKELEALKDIVLDFRDNEALYRQFMAEDELDVNSTTIRGMTLELGPGTVGHSHLIQLTAAETTTLRGGSRVTVTTEYSGGHAHQVTLVPKGTIEEPKYRAINMNPYEPHDAILIIPPSPEEDVGAL